MITSLGAQVVVEQTCFYENDGRAGASPVFWVGDDEPSPSFNQQGTNYVQGDWSCDYAAVRGTTNDENVTCLETVSGDAATCRSTFVNFSASW